MRISIVNYSLNHEDNMANFNDKQLATLERAVSDIKTRVHAETSVILELEFNSGWRDETADRIDCTECDATGRADCDYCDGSGLVADAEGVLRDECVICYGDGTTYCEPCNGDGYTLEYHHLSNEDDIHAWLSDWLQANRPNAYQALLYSKFEYDGTVDSEYTLAVRVSDVRYFPDYVDAIRALCAEFGNELSIGYRTRRSAGLHISIVPCSEWNKRTLNTEKLDNFERQAEKLLPMLYAIGTADGASRSFQYRRPRVSREDKYNAIFTHYGKYIEYRLFETCYDRPGAIVEYMTAIAHTLKFYADPTAKPVNCRTAFGIVEVSDVKDMYRDTRRLRVLNAQLDEITGLDKAEALKARKIDPSMAKARKADKARIKELREDYEHYLQRANDMGVRSRYENFRQYLRNVRLNDSYATINC